MYLYNSATHKKEEFKTHTPGHVEMYTCGPTVYHFAHIGNLRSYIMEDVLEKYLRYAGYDVNRVMNITDVGHLTSDADEGEDKMLKGAKREHKSVMEIAQYYTDAFFSDCRKLNIKRPDVVQPATGLIDDYIKIITKLIDTGYAKLDRAGLTALIDGSGWRLRAILCSHAHFDHTGNVRYLQERYGAKAAISLIEAGISVNPDSYRANYVALTYGKSRELFLEECFTADRVIFPQEDHIDVDGARFGVLSLPGHSAGQLGFVTPDGAAYLGDCLIDQHEIDAAKLPTSMFIAKDLDSKTALRATDYPAYIIAHKQVVTDRAELSALIDSNIAFIHRKERELLDDLTDGMTFSDWIYTFCQRENIRTRQELKFSIVERNFTNFTDWLTDTGKVRVERDFCAKRYYHG